MCDCVYNNFLGQPYGTNSYSKCVLMIKGRGRVEKAVVRYVRTKWMAPNKYCGMFFVQWYGQVH